ncbi:DNA-directed RNA polymerase II subunit RPB9 [Pancytospora philotis]|nr:DNA-directed RNA polymerase II subunit RPB9 [Pancytospora philotis]
MAIQFCRECNNLLHPRTEKDALHYVCNRCETIAEPASPVIYSMSLKTKHGSNPLFAQHLMHDPTLPRFSKACARCAHDRCISYMEENEEKALNSYYVCMKCFHEWTD